MNMFEEAAALSGMLKMRGTTQESLAGSIGVSQSYIANKLRLLKHTEEHRQIIIEKGLSERHARALLRIENEEVRGELLHRITERNLTVAETEALVDLYYEKEAPNRIGKSDKLSAIGSFRDTVKSSIDRLLSLGVDAHQRVTYDKDKLYITIAITER